MVYEHCAGVPGCNRYSQRCSASRMLAQWHSWPGMFLRPAILLMLAHAIPWRISSISYLHGLDRTTDIRPTASVSFE